MLQPKPKYIHMAKDDLQPTIIRACIDLRVPNKFMKRTHITERPIVEDFIYKFHDCVVFSKYFFSEVGITSYCYTLIQEL